jgi:hypothetical protein
MFSPAKRASAVARLWAARSRRDHKLFDVRMSVGGMNAPGKARNAKKPETLKSQTLKSQKR